MITSRAAAYLTLSNLGPALIVVGVCCAGAAAAQVPEAETPAGFWDAPTLTGDWDGRRKQLEDAGLQLSGNEVLETIGNVRGGIRRDVVVDGRLELDADFDLDKLLGWTDTTAHISAYQIHGRGLSQNALDGNLLTVSNIEATRATRLFDAYVEPVFLNGALSIRTGQIAADDEFITSLNASTFINATFGWPGVVGADLPSGGPAYPLATPGLRAKYAATTTLSWQTAVFNGDPAGGGRGNPQKRDPSGLNFSTDQNVFVITELGYAVPAETDGAVSPESYKIGLWYDNGPFADLRLGQDGLPLASPASSGIAHLHRGNAGAYTVLDRQLWQSPDQDGQVLAGFMRLATTPAGDRDLVTAYGDVGMTLKAPVDGRPDDLAGIAVSTGLIGSGAAGFDRDSRRLGSPQHPIRNYEGVAELTYQIAVAPWWSLQPDLQYVVHPGGNIANPLLPGNSAIPNALVLGLRSLMKL